MARPKRESLKVVSVKLTPTAEQMLQQLSQEASDALGRPVSSSAVVRGLLEYARRQPLTWTAEYLHPVIEHEIVTGIVWGSKPQR